jgi:hypothetical protein
MIYYIPEGICFAAFVAFSCTWLHYARFHLFFFSLKTNRQQEKASRQNHAHKNQKTNEKTQQKKTNENVHSVTTFKKGQQKQRSRFLQEYKSKT